jgi:hypothetical protein
MQKVTLNLIGTVKMFLDQSRGGMV